MKVHCSGCPEVALSPKERLDSVHQAPCYPEIARGFRSEVLIGEERPIRRHGVTPLLPEGSSKRGTPTQHPPNIEHPNPSGTVPERPVSRLRKQFKRPIGDGPRRHETLQHQSEWTHKALSVAWGSPARRPRRFSPTATDRMDSVLT
jgi:hypothetical protein